MTNRAPLTIPTSKSALREEARRLVELDVYTGRATMWHCRPNATLLSWERDSSGEYFPRYQPIDRTTAYKA